MADEFPEIIKRDRTKEESRVDEFLKWCSNEHAISYQSRRLGL